MKHPSEEVTKKFINGLAAHGLTYEEFKQTWKYGGGNRGSHLNYYNLCYSHLAPPMWADSCVCGQRLVKENCYATDGTDFVVIGNCCIKKFVPKCTRTCDNCGEPHKNRIVNRCNTCRKEHSDRTYKRYPCDKCDETHTNRVAKICESCRRGYCDNCDCAINPNYRKCYSCHLKGQNSID